MFGPVGHPALVLNGDNALAGVDELSVAHPSLGSAVAQVLQLFCRAKKLDDLVIVTRCRNEGS